MYNLVFHKSQIKNRTEKKLRERVHVDIWLLIDDILFVIRNYFCMDL